MKETITSPLFRINVRDILKALLLAILAPVLQLLYDTLVSGAPIDWKLLLSEALVAGLGYLLKNFFTSQRVVSKPEFEKHDAGPHN